MKLESKQNENAPVAKKSVATLPSTSKQKRPPPTKVVEDFDILNIPSHVDLSGLMREFFMPNMPDGFTIKMQEKIASDAPTAIQSINDILTETNSPRWLYPKRTETRPLQIVEKPSTSDTQPEQSTYMFSQLLNDLNGLWEQQEPFFERQSDEHSEMLSMSVTDGQDSVDAESESNFKDMSILRTGSDYPFSFLPVPTKEETIDEAKKSEDEESEEDSVDIDDDVENENLERSLAISLSNRNEFNEIKLNFSVTRRTFIRPSVDGVCAMSTIRNSTRKNWRFNFVRDVLATSVSPSIGIAICLIKRGSSNRL